ncbi:MAG: DUF2064 domain-containing protein [Pseudomonadota bacterium]|nr:DUF2064 domain-containing protein [Pseudomonadota bacterium]
MISLNIFAKCPNTGNPKQRMGELLDKKGRSDLAKIMLINILEEMHNINISLKTNLWVYPNIDNEWIKKLSKKYFITLKKQIGESLCSRMQNCLLSESALGGKTLLIGTDIPALSKNSISKAIKTLNNNNIVIGPTYDEGFYLIGIKDQESAQCLANCENLKNYKDMKNMNSLANQKIYILEKLKDIDNPNDLLLI